MNKTLALYFDDQFVIGAVEPYEGKFTRITKGDRDRFYLSFYIHDGRIDYGKSYQVDVEKGDHRAVGDIYEKIASGTTYHFSGYDREYVSLMDSVMDDIKESYVKVLSSMADSNEFISVSEKIPVKAGFSPNIEEEARVRIISWLEERNFHNEEQNEGNLPGFSQLIIQHKTSQRSIKFPGIYALVEGLNADLNVTLAETNAQGKMRIITHATYPGFGTDPRVGVISRFVVDKANESIHLLHTQKDKENEYRKKLRLAAEWNHQLIRSRRPFIYVKVALSPAPRSEISVSVQKKEIDGLTMIRSQQVARYAEHAISQHLPMADLTGIIIFGDSLKNSQVLDGFYRFGKEKLIVHSDDQIFDTLKGLFSQRDEVETLVDAILSGADVRKQPAHIQAVNTVDLRQGDKVEFTWDPNRKVIAELQSNGTFRIIEHEHSSIITGDTFLADQIQVGQRAFLKNVVRPSSGQVLGNYQSGVIKSLQLTRGN